MKNNFRKVKGYIGKGKQVSSSPKDVDPQNKNRLYSLQSNDNQE